MPVVDGCERRNQICLRSLVELATWGEWYWKVNTCVSVRESDVNKKDCSFFCGATKTTPDVLLPRKKHGKKNHDLEKQKDR